MARVFIPACASDITNRHIGGQQIFGCTLHAPSRDVFVWRRSDSSFEQSREMKWTYSRFMGERCYCHAHIKMVLDISEYSLDPCVRKIADNTWLQCSLSA